jgi:putative hemolysin
VLDYLPYLIALSGLVAVSAFFSCSEAALFSLRGYERRVLAAGRGGQAVAARLLEHPDRLLPAILFWNMTINIAFFSVASIAALQIQSDERFGGKEALVFAVGTLLLLIFFGEMLPKSLGVLLAMRLASLVSLPLAALVRAADPIMPALQVVTLLSRRLVWPHMKPEPYLEVDDLERAIHLSTSDAQLIEQEHAVLQNIVALSDTRVDESMRPRPLLATHAPPIDLADLGGMLPHSGYLLVAERQTGEIAAAVHLASAVDLPRVRLERYAEPVLYVPWCTSLAATLEQMLAREREVAAVVNEHGETIGVLTFEDILDIVFTPSPTRSGRLHKRKAITQVRPGLWHITGLTSTRRLARFFQEEFPESRAVTLEGIVQDELQRFPAEGDECQWGTLAVKVLEAPPRGPMLMEVTRAKESEDEA